MQSCRVEAFTRPVHHHGGLVDSTVTPHVIGCDDEPVEVLTILDHDGERAHLRPDA